jgi:serine/threonine-protein kinase
MTERTTTLADRYVLGSLIARGGMAEVWTARDEVLARTVAVKMLHPHLAADPAFVTRFRTEALAAARLTHPNIVSIYDTGTAGSDSPERHFIVMEHCGSGTLGDLLQHRGPLDPQEVASIGATICDALAYAHSEGIVHRDIKPANVLLADHGNLKVTDFGIAKAAFVTQDLTTTGGLIGSVAYISPEQARCDEPDARSDLYSLGILLYELLCGRTPFKGETEVATALSHVRDTPDPVRTLRAGIPRQLDAIVQRALAKDPGDRFGSAGDMKEALTRVSGTAPSPGFEGSPRRPIPSETRVESAHETSETQQFLRTEGKRIAPVILLVVVAIAVAILIASLVGSPNGLLGRDNGRGGGNGAQQGEPVEVQSAVDFDPVATGGDGSEHGDDVHNASDGDPTTAWQTEGYNDSMEAQGKAGVGLVFDLGNSVAIDEVAVIFDEAGYAVELRAADDVGSTADDFEAVDQTTSSDQEHTFTAKGTKARYWLVWITALSGGTGRGTIAEVSFVGG